VAVTPEALHRPPAPPRIPRAVTPLIVAHVRDGSSNASGRLAPRPSRALTSINAASNHDVTQHSDADAPCKQAFTHTMALLQQLRYGQPLPRGLGHTTNPSAFALALSRKSAGTSQQRSTLSRRLTERQDISPWNTMTLGFTAYISQVYK
jgi:predicted transglutaminase-like cysteine proteinase